MLLTTENSTQQINAALLDLEKETKSNTKNSIISTVYAIIKGFFDELKQKIGTTGIWSVTQAEYDSLTTSERLEDKYYNVTDASTGFLSVTNTVENGNTQPVTSNAVYGALTNVTKYESFTVTSATGAYTVTSQYCYKEGNHIHIEAFGKTTQLITNASTQPLIVIPNNFAPITTERKNIGTVIINNNSIYPSVAFAEVYNTLHCITQAVTDSIDNNTRVSFIIDYNINL